MSERTPLRRQLGNALYTAREALSVPGTRRAALQDIGPRAIHGEDDRHLGAAIEWLCRAQDVCPDGGVSYGYDIRRGWMAAYPETTGYIVPTLFDSAGIIEKRDKALADRLRRRAVTLARWLIGVQLESGAIPGGTVEHDPKPTVFNTGQVMDGWCRALRETGGDDLRQAIHKAADWLVSIQDDDGCWRRGLSPLTANTPAVYNVRTASVLLRAAHLLNEPSWAEAAMRNGDWVLTEQRPNGWFDNNCVSDNARPLTHTIGYTLEGLLEMAVRGRVERYLAAVMRSSDALLPHVADDGFLAGRFDSEWSPAVSWNCLTGASQLAMVWFRLARVTGDEKYTAAARRVLDFVKSTQAFERQGEDAGVVGAIKGSHPIWGRYEPFAYPNWATKFFADALLASPQMAGAMALTPDWIVPRTPAVAGLRVGYVVEDYPTFIVSEINQLRRNGAHVSVFSAFRPQAQTDPLKDAVRRESIYFAPTLPHVLWDNVRVAARRPIAYARTAAKLIWERETLRFLVLGACHAEVVRKQQIRHVHGTFGTRTTALAYVISRLSGINFSFTTHAYDVFRPNPSLVWKTNAASFMRTISEFNRSFIERTYGIDRSRIRVLYLGIDPETLRLRQHRTGTGPIQLLTVASLIEQKGHLVLVRACARLARQGLPFQCAIVGEGPLRPRLEQEIRHHGLERHVRIVGALPHAQVLRELQHADIFTLPCIDMRGRGEHVDGIPVVLMEAMAAGLPVVSTKLSGIPEIIESDHSGVLVPPEDSESLAAAIATLARDKDLRSAMGSAARAAVSKRFNLECNTAELARLMSSVSSSASDVVRPTETKSDVITERFHVKPGYVVQRNPRYYRDMAENLWQPDVYTFAFGLARSLGVRTVVDIGCGKASKLRPFLDSGIDIVGLDDPENVSWCRESYPQGDWRSIDLETIDAALAQNPALIDARDGILIAADVIEHLKDPMPLLRALRECMRTAKLALISTPERDLLHGPEHMGPPVNEAHIREWNRAEFEALLRASGLNVLHVGLTRAHSSHTNLQTTLAVVGPAMDR